jgi:hypothetical protein
MLGEKLAEYRGRVTGQRVLPSDGPYPKVETTFEISGPILGMESTMMGTYWSTVRSDGTLYGECPAGALMTHEGAMATWTGTGLEGLPVKAPRSVFGDASTIIRHPRNWPALTVWLPSTNGTWTRTEMHTPPSGNGNSQETDRLGLMQQLREIPNLE